VEPIDSREITWSHVGPAELSTWFQLALPADRLKQPRTSLQCTVHERQPSLYYTRLAFRAVVVTNLETPLTASLINMVIFRHVFIGAGRILKVEGHSGGSNYFGAKRRKIFGAPHFSVVPTQFLMELGAQPSKLNNSNRHF